MPYKWVAHTGGTLWKSALEIFQEDILGMCADAFVEVISFQRISRQICGSTFLRKRRAVQMGCKKETVSVDIAAGNFQDDFLEVTPGGSGWNCLSGSPTP